MDVVTTPPEEYAAWLQSQGVPPDSVGERMAHDIIRALSKAMDRDGVPHGFDGFKQEMDRFLAEDAMRRAFL